MLKAILVKLSLITVAASFVLSFSGTETMAAKCKKECASIADKAAHKVCMKDCKGKNKAAGGGKHKGQEKPVAATAAAK